MPYLVVCPNCGSKLKSGQPVPAGRLLTCPQCKAVFSLVAPAPEVEASATAPAVAAEPPAPSPVPPAKPPARSVAGALDAFSSAKGRAGRDEVRDAEMVDDDDRPRPKRRRDEDDDRPRSRRPSADEGDDRPRSRRGRDDDADDDRPRSKRRRDDDEEAPRPAGRRRRDDDEDEPDDRPRSRRRPVDDDEDERPKSRRPPIDDDEDERPKSRRPPVDDDEDERPKSRRGRPDDEEDEPPRGRKARTVAAADSDEDEDDRASRRGRRTKKKKGKGLLIGLLAGAAALLFLGGAAAVLYFADPFGWFAGGASSDMLAWAPSDSQMVIYMDVEAADKVEGMKDGFKGEIADSAKLGLKPEDVSAVLGAGKGGVFMGMGDPEVTVIKLRAAADRTKLINTSGGKEATANGEKYYKTSSGGGLYFASDKLLVVTKSEATMTSLLQKEKGKVTISDELHSATKRGDGVMWMVATGPAAEQGDIIGLMSSAANMFKQLGKGGPGPGKPASKCKSTLMSVKASGSRATAKFESTYDSADTAKTIADDLKKAMEQTKSKSTDLESFDVSTSGATVSLTMTGPIKKSAGGFPGLPFGGGR